jgi:predicted DNA repair protein MutK
LLAFAPWLMKLLSVLGTAAMFLVGGGIIAHGLPWLEHGIKGIAATGAGVNGVGPALSAMTPMLGSLLVGLVAGAIAVAFVGLAQKTRQALR